MLLKVQHASSGRSIPRELSTKKSKFALQYLVNIEAVVEGLVRFGEDDWIGMWVIVADVADELAIEDSQAQHEATLVVVKELLRRGFLAGESPASGDGVRFLPWPDQDPDVVVELVRRQWMGNADYPAWGDGPWFAAPRFCRFDA